MCVCVSENIRRPKSSFGIFCNSLYIAGSLCCTSETIQHCKSAVLQLKKTPQTKQTKNPLASVIQWFPNCGPSSFMGHWGFEEGVDVYKLAFYFLSYSLPKAQCLLSWVSSETDPFQERECKPFYLSGDLRTHWKEGMSEEMEGVV